MPLYQIGPNRWTNRPPEQTAARSDLPMPMIISDEMPALEQVDGSWHTSKRGFRAVGRSHGLTEVGNSKLPPRKDPIDSKEQTVARRESIQKAIAQYRQGRRAKVKV